MLALGIFARLSRRHWPINQWQSAASSLIKVDVSKVGINALAGQPAQSIQIRSLHQTQTLWKYIKKSTRDDDEDSEDDDEDEFKDERDSKVLKTRVNSLRADLLLKAGLGMARNKIENIFYSSKIRVNGKKLAKKSETLNIGDEIDVIRGFSETNPSHLVIARVIVLAASEREEGYSVSLRRYKSLLVENYAGVNAYKTSGILDN